MYSRNPDLALPGGDIDGDSGCESETRATVAIETV
jgi:hypothetical protein